MKRDLAQLYAQLDLPSDCTLAEFKLACRRRIQATHPDRMPVAEGDDDPLADLIWLYHAASRFHRRHGRLPGAAAPPRTRAPSVPRHAFAQAPAQRHAAPAPRDAPGATWRTWLVVAALLVWLSTLAWQWDWTNPAPQDPGDARLDPAAAAIAAARGELALGMDEATVLAIQGDPTRVRPGMWEYGPSWVRFESGRLVDWRSTPQARLKTTSDTPVARAYDSRNAGDPPRP